MNNKEKQKAIKFLKANKALENFVKNFEASKSQTLDYYFNTTPSKKFIICAFGWLNTTQEFEYWDKLEYRWQEALKPKPSFIRQLLEKISRGVKGMFQKIN